MFFKKEVTIMSWIKNKFNKLFNEDPNEMYEENKQDYYNEDHQEDNDNNQLQQHYERPTAIHNVPQEKNKTFRFPLIDDFNDEEPNRPVVEPTSTRFYEEESETLKLPDYLQKPVPAPNYEGEVSGIRDLLERRRKGRGYSNVIRSDNDYSHKVVVSKEEKEILTQNPMREESKVNQEFINPLANRKRFVPTEVPSPVHGFMKPTPIEKLMEKQHDSIQEEPSVKEQEVDAPVHLTGQQLVDDSIQENKEPVETIMLHQEPIEPIAEISEQLEETTSIADTQPIVEPISFELDEEEVNSEVAMTTPYFENVETPVILAQEKEVEEGQVIQLETQAVEADREPTPAEILNDVQVKHVTIENSTIHIGQLNVEQMPQVEQPNVQDQQNEPEQLQPNNTGSRIPFNVVMLKSDKEKMLTKKYVNEQLEQSEQPMMSVEESPIEVEGEITSIQVTVNASNELQFHENDHLTFEKVEETLYEENAHPANDVEITEQLVEIESVEKEPIKFTITAPEKTSVIPVMEQLDEQPVQSEVAVGTLEREEIIEEAEPYVEEIMEVEPLDVVEQIEQAEVVANQEPLPMIETEVMDEQVIEPVSEKSKEQQAPEMLDEQPETLNQEDLPVVESEQPVKKRIPYVKPPLEYLAPPEEMVEDRDWMDEQGENLVETLSYFQIQAQIESIVQGPAVTQFEITVGHGTKVSKVRNLADDIKLSLAAKDIRIDAPIPGKRSIGIEIPNRISRSVRLSEVTDSESFRNSDSPLEAALGLDLTGKPVTIDLRKMPHGLIAGATGSGKSVCINSILVSLLYKSDPNELKLMLIDPKMVELAPFNNIPHLVSPVITDVKAATAALKWAVEEMERRYQLFMHSGARKIEAYNKMCDENGMYAQKLPYLLIVIDELADLMMMSPQDVEDSIVRITQKARAAGIHLIVATQRPSVDVITGLIKSNIPTRIAFSVSSQIDSRTILDSQGAERLLGKGDMLYLGNGMSAPTRIQGTFVTDDEIEEIIEFVREQGEPEYIFKQEELLKRTEAAEEQDELFEEVCRFVFEQGSASTSLLQRRYHIGYNRAARLIDMLEREGYVSEPKGSKPRDVFITEADLSIQFGD